MKRIHPISYEQTIEILSGPRTIPTEIRDTVENHLNNGVSIVDVDRFSEFVSEINMVTPHNHDKSIEATHRRIILLGSCSIEMAWQQAGDIALRRPRRLHEHNQSVLNTYNRVFADTNADPRDKILRPMFALQDGGKAHCVSLADPNTPRKNKKQAVHNDRVATNILDSLPNDVLSPDEKTAIRLLIRQNAIGPALYRHSEKGADLDEVVEVARQKLDALRKQCPPDFQDRFDDHLLISYLADAGAHTQRAQYIDTASGEIKVDVSHEDRFTIDGTETGDSLDRLFSEAPEDLSGLVLFQPKHLAVMRQLFPDHYE